MSIVYRHREDGCLFLQKTIFLIMKNTFMITLGIMGLNLVSSCSSKSEIDSKISEVEKKYQDSLNIVLNELKDAKAKIEVLSYPADQRFLKAKELLSNEELD